MQALAPTVDGRPDSTTLAERLQDARLQRGWTRRELADRAGYSSAETIRRYERELVHDPHESILIHLAHVLGVNPAWLITGRGSQTPRRR
jgi:transcriptional regulator with XRE-family HTH domain